MRLKPQILRLPVYWDEVEKEPGNYDFSQTDKYMEILERRKIETVLVLGFKQPRWPECFQPLWSKSRQDPEFNQSILDLLQSKFLNLLEFLFSIHQ